MRALKTILDLGWFTVLHPHGDLYKMCLTKDYWTFDVIADTPLKVAKTALAEIKSGRCRGGL